MRVASAQCGGDYRCRAIAPSTTATTVAPQFRNYGISILDYGDFPRNNTIE
jgi:hypothetical protein